MQATTLKIFKTGENVFITGSAGTGKTYVLSQYIRYLRDRDVFPTIVAPTGIAASHLRGQTIHSYFSLGIRDNADEDFVDELLGKDILKKRFKKLEVLIVDEISMVTPEIFDSIDRILKAFKKNNLPFGGVQVILSGDFFQLPPISKNRSDKRFAWQADSWRELDLQTCYLEKKYRQEEEKLISVLDEIRSGEITDETHETLKSRINKELDIDFTPTNLYTHNFDVDRINNEELAKLDSEEHIFEFIRNKGTQAGVDKIFRTSLIQRELVLKIDTLVMFVKNNPENDCVNGTTGIVVGFSGSKKLPIVKLANKKRIVVEREEWSVESDGNVEVKISQIPLKLAWAITIHKSQGMTLDAAQIDLGKTFEFGQGYVALSRIKNIEGLKLVGYSDMALRVDPIILSIDHRIKGASKKAKEKFEKLTQKEVDELNKNHIKNIDGLYIKASATKGATTKKKKTETKSVLQTKEMIEDSKTIEDLVKNRKITINTVIKHLAIIKKEDKDFSIAKYLPEKNKLKEIIQAIEEVKKANNPDDLLENGDIKLKPIFEKLDSKVEYDEIRLVIADTANK